LGTTNSEPEATSYQTIVDDLPALLERVPPTIRQRLEQQPDLSALLEVVLDLGRLPEARFAERELYLGSLGVTQEDIEYVAQRVSLFGGDNRAGIERTLHRISGIRNRSGQIVGLTCRVGRAVFGTVRVVQDLVASGKNILLVGRPGVGKTTMLREMARVLADDARKRVVIVDTSNEIAGDGDVPHSAIGRARRMQVPTPDQQHGVMIEAVENHMPEVIIIDEIGTAEEARAARTIAERGVQLIATAHGNTLENLLLNPTLSDLVGGVETVTLSDEEARRRKTQKAILERKAPPTFNVLIEMQSWSRVAVHADVAQTVDRLLRGQVVTPDVRWLDEAGKMHHSRQRTATDTPLALGRTRDGAFSPASAVPDTEGPAAVVSSLPATHIHPFGVSRERLAQAAREVRVPVQVTDSLADVDLVLTTKGHYRRGGAVLRKAEEEARPVFVLRSNTPAQLRSFLLQWAQQQRTGEPDNEGADGMPAGAFEAAVQEAEGGVDHILTGRTATVELQPQSAHVRRIQHRIAERAQLRSQSTGREPRRRVTIQGA